MILKVGRGFADWRERCGQNPRDRFAVSLATGAVTKLLDQGTIYGQVAAIGGVNRRYDYVAMESDNEQPDGEWGKYTGQKYGHDLFMIEVPPRATATPDAKERRG